MENKDEIVYERYLEELRHEDSLQNTRIMWLLIFEGFLLGSLKDGITVSYFIVLAGIVLAIISFLSIYSAISAWRNFYRQMVTVCTNLNAQEFPQLYRGIGSKNITRGHLSALFIPTLFMLIWGTILVFKLNGVKHI